ncbi:hypothetical protein K9U40_10220 [Xanthobacter autotrophicus]|uniref:hypothetical protein n=1 Tax=Xanthobacter TaxID=279 RepID=UPI0024AB4903|nr:hypothetical protein [Xanthobacter autotrophicus]MDI4664700.1 hypothetical protein [Xanthobacter autotrophicus]
MSLAEDLARDRRRLILEHLAAAEGHGLGAGVLETVVAQARHRAWRDVVQADIALLAQHNLVRTEDLPSAIGLQTWVELTGLGLDVANGREHPAVAPKLPSY